MANLTYFNYWTDKIEFKEKIANDLMPVLQQNIGQEVTIAVLDNIKKQIGDWMLEIDEVVFDCELKIEVEKKDKDGKKTDFIKDIRVIPIDV